MSLTVSPDLIEQAQHGEIDDAAFTRCIAASLPYAWQVITGLIGELNASGADLADNQVPPPDEAAAGSCCGSWPATRCAAPSNGTTASGWRSRIATAPRCSDPARRRPTRNSSPPAPRSSTSARTWSTAELSLIT